MAQQSVNECQNWVAGSWVPSKEIIERVSPYTGKVFSRVHTAAPDTVEKAVQAAQSAFHSWRRTPIKERCAVVARFRELVLAKLDEIGELAALEAGKTPAEGRAGILKGLEVAEFAISLQNLDDGGHLEVSRGVTCTVKREPLGVVVGIVPFNFPAMVPMWMYPIAIALGNAFILKPSEKVAATSTKMAELWQAAGLPAGIFQLIQGQEKTVHQLIDHPLTQAVAFVGSTPVALDIYRRATSLGKRALCLGGAKNHLIVVPDADPEMTSRGVVDSFTGCAGQRCMAASVLVAVGEVEALIKQVVDKARQLELGRDMGAIVDDRSLKRIEGAIDKAVAQGAKILLDGRKPKAPSAYPHGFWLGPTIIDQVQADFECWSQEIFGPVLGIVRVKNLAAAMELEQRIPFGNAVSVFTTSGAVAQYVSEHATSGMVGINIGVPVPREPFSFGGSKASKFGACDITGLSGVEFWSQLKKVTTKWALQTDHNWMS